MELQRLNKPSKLRTFFLDLFTIATIVTVAILLFDFFESEGASLQEQRENIVLVLENTEVKVGIDFLSEDAKPIANVTINIEEASIPFKCEITLVHINTIVIENCKIQGVEKYKRK